MTPTWQPVSEPEVLAALQTQGVSHTDAETMQRELRAKLEHQAEADKDATVGRMVKDRLVTLHRDASGYEVGVMGFPGSWMDEASSLGNNAVRTAMLELQASLQGLRDVCQTHWSEPPDGVRHWMAGLDPSGPFLALESWLQFGELLAAHPDAPPNVLQAWLGATGVALIEGSWVSRAGFTSQA
jgi:hypothetical protein